MILHSVNNINEENSNIDNENPETQAPKLNREDFNQADLGITISPIKSKLFIENFEETQRQKFPGIKETKVFESKF